MPVRILQFGEGNFLRAFADWMINCANKTIGFNTGVVIVQPLRDGLVDVLKRQDNLYHVRLEGVENENPISQTELIDCIQDAVNPYVDYTRYEKYFLSPNLKFIISHTTEAGIVRMDNDDISALPPASFPGKICQLLYNRYKHFKGDKDKGLTFFCCELIEKNATLLHQIVLELAQKNNLGESFVKWVNNNCCFCNTLVDRIVTGNPETSITEIQHDLEFKDDMMVVAEPYHLWAIEAPIHVREKFPLDKAGLNVVWVDDMTPYHHKKVRILNGTHTVIVPLGILCGYHTVKDVFLDEVLSGFVLDMLHDEVIPYVKEDKETLEKFVVDMLERFQNPFLNHFLKYIGLNSLSKWMARNYPSFYDGYNIKKRLPDHLTFSLAAMLVMYRGQYKDLHFEIRDTPEHVSFIRNQWKNSNSIHSKVKAILKNKSIWDTDLDAIEGLSNKVADYITTILDKGIREAIQQLNNKTTPNA